MRIARVVLLIAAMAASFASPSTACEQCAALASRVSQGLLSADLAAQDIGTLHPAASPAPSGAPTAGGYRVGLNFLDAPHQSPYIAWWNTSLQPPQVDPWYYPVQITDPLSNAVTDGGMAGWSEAAARRAVTLAVEDAYRAVDTGDPGRTLAIQIYEGAISAAGPGRRMNAVLGEHTGFSNNQAGYSLTGSAFNGNFPNGSDLAAVFLQNLDIIPGVAFDQSSDVINNIAGTAAHEIGHLFGLEHVQAGIQEPHALMASGTTGLTNDMRLTLRRFNGIQPPPSGEPSASVLLSGIGTVAKADFNMDGVVNGAGDVPIFVGNFGRTDALFQEGDANGDHLVNGAGDFPILAGQFGTDVVGPGEIIGEYDPATGNVYVSMNNIGSLRIISDDNQLIPANVPNSIPGSIFHDATTTNETNYGGFPLTTQDDFLMGALLPTGLALPNEQFVQANLGRILYTVFGGGTSQTNLPLLLKNLAYVPEPSSLVLAGLAGVGFWLGRRRIRRETLQRCAN